MELNSFKNLVLNENMKIYSRIGTWVMIGLLLISVLGVGLIDKYMFDEYKRDWRVQLEENNTSMEITLEQVSIPKSLEDEFRKEIAINNYRLENNLPPIESKSLWGFMITSKSIISFVTLFTIIIAAGSVASEFSWGTIKLLLIRPVSRSKILASKYIGSLSFAFVLLILLFVFSFIVGGLFYGFGSIEQPYLAYVDGNVIEQSMLYHVLSLYGYSAVNLLMFVTFAFMLSTVFRSSSLSIGLAIFLMFTGQQVAILLSSYEWAKYILFANIDLMQYVDGVPIVEGNTMGFSALVLTAYFIIFNTLSWLVFNKRDVAV